MTENELDELDELALTICASIDEGAPCSDGPSDRCARTAEAVVEFLNKKVTH